MKKICKSILLESCLVIVLTLLYLWKGYFSHAGEAEWYAGLYGVSESRMDYLKIGVWIVPFWSVLTYALKDLQQEWDGLFFFTSIRHDSCWAYIKQLLLKTGKKSVGMAGINCVWFIIICTVKANICGHQIWINWEHMMKASVLYILGVLFLSVITFWIFVYSKNLYMVLGSQIVFFSMLFFISYFPKWIVNVFPICWSSLIYSSKLWKDGYHVPVILLIEGILIGVICICGKFCCKKRKLKVLR